jgi:hypothetical protein
MARDKRRSALLLVSIGTVKERKIKHCERAEDRNVKRHNTRIERRDERRNERKKDERERVRTND